MRRRRLRSDGFRWTSFFTVTGLFDDPNLTPRLLLLILLYSFTSGSGLPRITRPTVHTTILAHMTVFGSARV